MNLSLAQIKREVEDTYRNKHKLGSKDRIPVKARRLILAEAQRLFKLQNEDEEAVHNTITCPRCDSSKIRMLKGGKRAKCESCGYEGRKSSFP